MTTLPFSIGTIHFVGIGGIGMSGIAEILHSLSYRVQGSDAAENANVKRLVGMGIDVKIGHQPEHIGDAAVVVFSSAVAPDNPEIIAARSLMIPVVRRAEMLAEIMRLKWGIAVGGTHGKTTTTSIIAALLDGAQFDPTVINGGIINAYGTNARLGQGDWIVVEADESDGSFVKLPATVAVVTNIDPEHLDFYGSFDELRGAFASFVENVPFYGFATLCIDDPDVQALIADVRDRRVITYGMSPQADVRAANIDISPAGSRFDVMITDRTSGKSRTIGGVHLPMIGAHNIQNSLAGLAIAQELGIKDDVARRALAEFKGVRRRFTKTGDVGGITVIDDYGHHPVEIAAVLSAARTSTTGNVIAVVQPHRYTRLRDLFEDFCACFNDADTVIVADVYAAGEAPIDGFDRDALVAGLQARGHRNVTPLIAPETLADHVADLASSGDYVVCLGAGNITAWANALPAELKRVLGDTTGRRTRGQR